MDLSTLKMMRKLVPGSVFIFFGIPAYRVFVENAASYDEALKFPLESYGAVIAFIIGAFFCSYKTRSFYLDKSVEFIDKNIFERLYLIGRGVSAPQALHGNTNKRILVKRVFYKLVDGDESLKEKGKLVRDNGLLWSSCADVVLLGLFFSYVYLVLSWWAVWFMLDKLFAFGASGILIGLIGLVFSILVFPRVQREQVALSNSQIDIIQTFYSTKLKDLLDEQGI